MTLCGNVKCKFEVQQEAFYIMYTLLQNKIIKEDSYVIKHISSRLLEGDTFCYDDIKNIKASLMRTNSTANKYFGIWEDKNAKERLDKAISLVPVIGSIKGFIDILNKENIFTGRKLTWWESVLNITCLGMDTLAVGSLAKVCLTEARAIELGLELKCLSEVGYSQEVAEMIASGKNAIKYARTTGITDANQLSKIGESVSEAVSKAYKSGITDTVVLAKYGEAVAEAIDVIGNGSGWMAKLTQSELNALRTYQGENVYSILNSGLRNGTLREDLKYLLPEIDMSVLKGLITQDTILYRGLTHPDIIGNWSDILRTQSFKFTDAAYVSTSTKETVAEMFTMAHDADGIFAIVKVPKGISVANVGEISSLIDEGEILLGRGHSYKITKAWEENGMKHIIMEVQ